MTFSDFAPRRACSLLVLKFSSGIRLVDPMGDSIAKTYTRVAGHSGHPENDRCDELAVAAYQQYLS